MEDLNNLYKYLLSDNILEYEKEIFDLIPELKIEKGFEQKNDWHCFDVWGHTIATIDACDKNAEDRLIMLLHDLGKPFSYQDEGSVRHFKNHAYKSAIIANNILDRLGIPNETKKTMLKLIEMHSTRVNPEDMLDNMEFYKRLLKIQKCDARGYEKEHSIMILEKLNDIESKLLSLDSKDNGNKKEKIKSSNK